MKMIHLVLFLMIGLGVQGAKSQNGVVINKSRHVVEMTTEVMPDGSVRHRSRVVEDLDHPKTKAAETLFNFDTFVCAKGKPCQDKMAQQKEAKRYIAPGYVD